MLTKDLLEVTKRKPNIKPKFREPEEYRGLAKEVVDRYEVGKKKKEIEKDVSKLESHGTFKLVRGLSKLLERRAEFEMDSPVKPKKLRESVYREGYVTDEEERKEVIKSVAESYGLSVDEVEKYLWADREEEMVLQSMSNLVGEGVEKEKEKEKEKEEGEIEIGIDPVRLIREYNLSLAQTLLFDAVELEFSVSENFQQIFRMIKYLGLIYDVDEDLKVNVTGPASLFKKTRKYGTSFAKLLPHIMKAEEWEIEAQVETEVSGEKRIYKFKLNSDSEIEGLFPELEMRKEGRGDEEKYHSEVERDFSSQISSNTEGWMIEREPTILRAGNRVMIPDFSFRKGKKEFYLEVVGFWTPEYLREKMDKIREVESEKPLLLAVDEELKCTKEDFGGSDKVIFYDKKIPLKPVLKELQALEEEMVEEALEVLEDEGLELPKDDVAEISELVDEKDLARGEEAAERYIKENFEGLISNGKYVPPRIADNIKEEIEGLESDKLSAVNEVLERYGLAQNVLSELGYEVRYVSLDQSEARIEK